MAGTVNSLSGYQEAVADAGQLAQGALPPLQGGVEGLPVEVVVFSFPFFSDMPL